MIAAVRARHPAKLVAAAGVASGEALSLIRQEADDVVCLEEPPMLVAIGHYFRDFSQVSDEDVVAALRQARLRRVRSRTQASQDRRHPAEAGQNANDTASPFARRR